MRRHFHHFVVIYRIGILAIAVLLFTRRGTIRTVLSIATTPCTFTLVSLSVFVSSDLLGHLAHSYEFWFLVTINALNWSLFAFILNGVRSMVCFPAWLAFQTVIMIDANYRTYPTALASTVISSPLIISMAGLVAARRIRDAHYFQVFIGNHLIGDAADFITFTSFNLVFFLVRMVILKKVRMHHSFNNARSIPCVVIKATLRLVPVDQDDLARRRHGITETLTREVRSHSQHLIFCPPPLTHIDARRTVLPHRFWEHPPRWITAHSRRLRMLFHAVGTLGWSLLLAHTLVTFWHELEESKANMLREPRSFRSATRSTKALICVASILSLTFCGGFALFFQRGLVHSLFRNFDFLFSNAQSLIFVLCYCDLHNWDFERALNITTWAVWFFWTLTLDALTPIVKDHVFKFRKLMAAPVLVSIIVGTATIGIVIVFIPNLGLHNRDIWSFRFSHDAVFTIHTESLLLGRVVTILLWCTRQAFLLFTRRDDELNLLRGAVEYTSPYCTFPSVRTATTAVITAQTNPSVTHRVLPPRATLLHRIVFRPAKIHHHAPRGHDVPHEPQ